jgi:hypothetical protein
MPRAYKAMTLALITKNAARPTDPAGPMLKYPSNHANAVTQLTTIVRSATTAKRRAARSMFWRVEVILLPV